MKIPTGFLVKTDKIILKFTQKSKGTMEINVERQKTLNSNEILNNIVGEHTLPDFNLLQTK